MNELYPGLPPDLENDWIDAISTGEVSTPLARFLADHPKAADELASLGDVAGGLRADRDAAHPGAHFFDALASDIMGALPAGETNPRPAALVGRKTEDKPAPAQSSWSAAWAWFGKRPTLAWAAVMALALVAILAWPAGEPAPGAGIAVTAPDAGPSATPDVDASPQPSRDGWLAAALPDGLSPGEVHELRQMAAGIQLPELDDAEDGLDDDWGLGVGAAAVQQMGTEELDSALDALEAPL